MLSDSSYLTPEPMPARIHRRCTNCFCVDDADLTPKAMPVAVDEDNQESGVSALAEDADDCILVVEDLTPGGGYVGFCGVVTPGDTSSAYICVRGGREIASSVAKLLVRALRAWISGLEAAAKPVGEPLDREANLRSVSPTGEQAKGGSSEVAEELSPAGGLSTTEKEMVDWVDTEGRVFFALPRTVVHDNNILHRGASVMIRNSKVRVKRTGVRKRLGIFRTSWVGDFFSLPSLILFLRFARNPEGSSQHFTSPCSRAVRICDNPPVELSGGRGGCCLCVRRGALQPKSSFRASWDDLV